MTERDVYLRLRECGIAEVDGHNVPAMLDFDDSLRILEMSIVKPPYILDFAKAQIDTPLDFPDYVMAERYEHWSELFEERWPEVLSMMRELDAALWYLSAGSHAEEYCVCGRMKR